MLKAKEQTYNDGVAIIYSVKNCAEPGKKRVDQLKKKETIRFDSRTVGIRRFWEAMQNDVEIEAVIRCPRRPEVSTRDIVTINGDNKKQYEVKQVQYPKEITPPVMDLTLVRIGKNYEI